MKGFLDLPYRLPFARHYKAFDAGFYVDFPEQLRLMGRWLRESGCRRTLDVGAMTGGCIEHVSKLGIRMDGVQFTEDVKRLAAANLRRAGIRSTLHVVPVHAELRLPTRTRYDGIVSLGWFNLPFTRPQLRRRLDRIRGRLVPGGVFLFDFFEFRDVKVAPPETLSLGGGLHYASRSELRGRVLRRHHLWVDRTRGFARTESSDLVDRPASAVRRLLAESGFRVERTESLDLNYPREFWLART
jgi:SAM-dependent methyltransferase